MDFLGSFFCAGKEMLRIMRSDVRTGSLDVAVIIFFFFFFFFLGIYRLTLFYLKIFVDSDAQN